MKKAFKIIGITILILFFILLATPFVFQSQIKDLVKTFINQNVKAKVAFSDVSLSLLKSFPEAHVEVSDLVITNFEPFKDETLATVKNIALTMSVKELFKNTDQEPIIVNTISVNNASLNLKTDSSGAVNYTITKETENTSTNKPNSENNSFSFNIEDYSITNSAITYSDESTKTVIRISELNHYGKGKISANTSELNTNTEANVSISMDSTTYLSNNPITLEALIDLDLNNQKYTFKDNKGSINQLPITFNGYVQFVESGQDIDITFQNPGSSFKDFLAVIPKVYSKNIEDVKTTGDFKVKGRIKGLITEHTIPKLDISITSNNASFKYPNLPKSVDNITLNTVIKNETGKTEDTYIDIKTLNFKIDQDAFKSSAIIKNLMGNMLVNADIDGTLNLENITKAYPIELDQSLTGILKAKLNTAFDMNAIEINAYERIKNNGSVSISDFIFSSEAIVNPIHIYKADINFNPTTVNLTNFISKTGESDLNATGTIHNLLGFLLSDKKLQGNFNVKATTFRISDFMSVNKDGANNSKQTTGQIEALKIPDFLDCTINANVGTVVYDNLNLSNLKGSLLIKNQQATLKDMTTTIFDGVLAITGDVSTKADTPTFNLNLGADHFDIAKSFKDLKLFQNIAPIAKLLQGKMNSAIQLSGTLDHEFSPNLNSVSGTALVELLTTKINTNKSELFSKLDVALGFIDFSKLNLKDLKTKLEFANGKVNVKPFQLKYDDIIVEVSGSHSFDKTLSYNAVFDVPAKYLGTEVNNLIEKINDNEVSKITIPVTANITGSYTKPTITTDLTSGITNLTKQLIDIEKQKLINKGKGKVEGLLSNLLGKNEVHTTTKDTTVADTTTTPKTDPVKEGVKGILGNFIKNKRKKDSLN